MSNDADGVLELERRRCAAIGRGDLKALRDCLAEDYLHVFGDGRSCDREAYVEVIAASPREPERSDLRVRLYDNVAVLTGDLLNRIWQPGGGLRVVATVATQVAVRTDGKWRFVSFQLTQKKV